MRPSPGLAGGPDRENAFMIEGTQGPMARSVKDCALFLDAMSGFDSRIAIFFDAGVCLRSRYYKHGNHN